MTKITRLELLEIAKKLTGKTNISDLIKAAAELETYLDIQTTNNPSALTFQEFLKDAKVQTLKGALPFVPYEFQERVIEALDAPEMNYMFNTARQMGMTAILAMYALWYAMTFPNKSVALVSSRLIQAMEILDRVKFTYETLPEEKRAGVITYNKSEIKFDNGSKITCRAAQATAFKGHSIDVLIIDQMAWISNSICYDVWQALMPTIVNADKIILNSCPSSDEGLFHHLWTTDQSFIKMEIPWYEHPYRDDAWAQQYRDQLGEVNFSLEFECKFVKRQPRPTP